MATSSFLNEVRIQDDLKAEKFVCALEKSENNEFKKVVTSKPYSNASREEIRFIFSDAQ